MSCIYLLKIMILVTVFDDNNNEVATIS